MRNYLFQANGELTDHLTSLEATIKSRVESLDRSSFNSNTDERIADHLLPYFHVEPLQLHLENEVLTQPQESKVDVSGDINRFMRGENSWPALVDGIFVSLQIPFSGSLGLWQLTPSQRYSGHFPVGHVIAGPDGRSGYIELSVNIPSDVAPEALASRIKKMFDEQKLMIQHYIGWSCADVVRYSNDARKKVIRAIQTRREQLGKTNQLAALLDIPIKADPKAPPILPVQLQPNIAVNLAPPPKGGLKPEPGIDGATYEKILQIIRHEGRSFESTPETFHKLNEEELRDVLLAHLRGHLKGAGNAEAFRKKGKTDILIQQDDRSAFIGECKIWGGQKQLGGDLEQLLGYHVWRDCKASLIIFNKDVAKFSELLTKVPEALRAHRLIVQSKEVMEEGEWRYVFRSLEDEGREITVHVFLINIFHAKKSDNKN